LAAVVPATDANPTAYTTLHTRAAQGRFQGTASFITRANMRTASAIASAARTPTTAALASGPARRRQPPLGEDEPDGNGKRGAD